MGLQFNFSNLEYKLQDLGNKISKEITEKALTEGAKIILKEQEKNVPFDTGHLESRLDISKAQGSGIKRKVNVGILNNHDRTATYGYHQEYGTRKMVGEKWMKKSWKNAIKNANEEIEKVIVNEILK